MHPFSSLHPKMPLFNKSAFFGEKVPFCLEIRRKMPYFLGVLPLTNVFYMRKYLFVSETEEKCLFLTIKCPFRCFKKCTFCWDKSYISW